MHIIDPEKLAMLWGLEWDEDLFEDYGDKLFANDYFGRICVLDD